MFSLSVFQIEILLHGVHTLQLWEFNSSEPSFAFKGNFIYKTRERKKYIEIGVIISIIISVKDCQSQGKMVACKEYN